MTGRWTKIRIVFCGVLLLGLGVRVVHKAATLQLQEAEQHRELADDRSLKEMVVQARRGRVLDRNGNELATTIEYDSISVNPRQTRHVPDAARKLARALRMDRAEVQRILEQNRFFAWLKRTVSPEISEAVQALKIPGVGIRKEYRRHYPGKNVAATVLGYTNRDGRGIEGLEKQLDRYLRGTAVHFAGLRDGRGRELLVAGGVDPRAAAGFDVKLTLDGYLTMIAQRALDEGIQKHNAKGGTAIVMDPRTGDILAIANGPNIDANEPGDAAKRGVRNKAVTDPYEPGSTMKTFPFVAALEAGLKPSDGFDCEMGRMKIGGRTINDDHPKGWLTATEIYKYSSNICTVKIARKHVGKERLYETLLRFGFGKKTGVPLPGEQRGIIWHHKKWKEIDFATNSYGQSMTVTPLQLVAAFSAIASGGIYRTPRLVTRIFHPDGREEPPPPVAPPVQVMSPKVAKTLVEIMKAPVEDGTGKNAQIGGYAVAGKTGTPLKVVDGSYDQDKYYPSFVGFVPADDPRLVIAVMVDEPQPDHYGGVVAAPVFKEIAEEALKYLGVLPDPVLLAAKREKEAKAALRAGRKPASAPEDEFREGFGRTAPPVETDLTLAFAVPTEAPTDAVASVPDFRGMSIGEAIRAARRVGLELLPKGSGVAVAQRPSAGARAEGGACTVTFRPGG